jgi:hypothetical protein
MTGEMGKRDVTPDAFPLHFAIARKFFGSVHPFDVYQGPYVLISNKGNKVHAKLWLIADNDNDGAFATVYNESNDRQSETFDPYGPDAEDRAIDMAYSVIFPEETPVVFRVYKSAPFKGDVIAIFPDQSGDMSPYTCGCYEHVGQHGACDPLTILAETRLAKPDEYANLKAELESRPYQYNLRILSRINNSHYQQIRRNALNAMRGGN